MDHSTKETTNDCGGKDPRLIAQCRRNVMNPSEIQQLTITKIQRIAKLSKQNPQMHFHSLMHHYNEESLTRCFHMLDARKAKGIDGVSKAQYGENIIENIKELLAKMKQMAYRPGPVREVLIPKENGKMRPLGISNFEDKIIQMMTAQILESIYEPLFVEDSYGFRPGRDCHLAIQELSKHLFQNEVEIVIDVDLANFFGTIDHQILLGILKEKIKDSRFIRYITRMFKAGVLTEGDLKVNDEGVPQGSICSPILANIFAHYAIDMWIEEMVKPRCQGQIRMFRYADDQIICCEYEQDAIKIRDALGKRLGKFNLKLNEEKTKLVKFSKAKARKGIKQETFDFLGFTFYWGKSKKGYTIPKVKTRGKSMRTKLKRANEWAQEIRNKICLKDIWTIFCQKIRGHAQYYGISHNTKYVEIFIEKATRILFKWLNRRSQKKSITWEQFRKFEKKFPLPLAKVYYAIF